MATEAKKAPEGWVSKEEAAKMLKVNPRQVEKRAQKGEIEKRYLEKLPTERMARVQYARADIEAIIAGKPNQHGVVTDMPGGPSGNGTADLALFRAAAPSASRLRSDLAWDAIAEAARAETYVSRPVAPPALRAWLTLDEAVEHSGLPAAFIAKLCESSQIDNIGRGPKTWRIRRASLDAYGEPKS